MKVKRSLRNPAAIAWCIFGGLVVLGMTTLVVREFPSMRRELRLLSM